MSSVSCARSKTSGALRCMPKAVSNDWMRASSAASAVRGRVPAVEAGQQIELHLLQLERGHAALMLAIGSLPGKTSVA